MVTSPEDIEDIAARIERRIQTAEANSAQVEGLHAQIDAVIAETRGLRFWQFIRRDRNAGKIQRLLNQAGALQSENNRLISENSADLSQLRRI